jgi:hypothetical protein
MPDNAAYYQAAYVAAFVVYTLYAASIWWRARRVRERLMERGAGERRGSAGD